jgi:hypothetical protein
MTTPEATSGSTLLIRGGLAASSFRAASILAWSDAPATAAQWQRNRQAV